jgi:hypothetical protein
MEADDPIPIIRTATKAIPATPPLATVARKAERDAHEQINELLPVVDRDGDDGEPLGRRSNSCKRPFAEGRGLHQDRRRSEMLPQSRCVGRAAKIRECRKLPFEELT